MKEYTNKEVIERLTSYFLDNDPKIVARLLANATIDFHRLMHPEEMTKKEKECLAMRMELNDRELMSFIENGPTRPLTHVNMNSDEL